MRAKIIVSNVAIFAFLVSPLALLLLSGWSALAGPADTEPNITSWVLIALASLVASLNLHLSFLRPFLYAKRHGDSSEGYRHVFGVPIVGSILTALAVLATWGQMSIAAIGLALLVVDTGGVVWLLVALSSDKSFWDRTA